MTMNKDSIVLARLSIQRALLGNVSANLRAVVFSFVGININIKFYFDGFISEEDIESVSLAEAEVIADYSPEDTVSIDCIRLDFPSVINDGGVWVYQRREQS